MKFQVSAMEAIISCIGMSAAYVGVLYCAPAKTRSLPRDHPTKVYAYCINVGVLDEK